jgi:hypothetical protein
MMRATGNGSTSYIQYVYRKLVTDGLIVISKCKPVPVDIAKLLKELPQ